MLTIENLLLWDDVRSPVRVPRIEVDPDTLKQASESDGWIIAGPYRIKIIVEKDSNGLKVLDTNQKVLASSAAGHMFIDDSMFTIASADEGQYKLLGHARGCFDFGW